MRPDVKVNGSRGLNSTALISSRMRALWAAMLSGVGRLDGRYMSGSVDETPSQCFAGAEGADFTAAGQGDGSGNGDGRAGQGHALFIDGQAIKARAVQRRK